MFVLSQACLCVFVPSLPSPSSQALAIHHNKHTQPQLHGIYATLFPLAQPTALTTKLEHCNDNNKNLFLTTKLEHCIDNNKNLFHRLRATEQVLA